MRTLVLISGLSLALTAAPAQKPTTAALPDPGALPAHETHQGVTVAARPLTTETGYKSQFTGRTPYEAGILALEVFFRNENDKPIRLKLEDIRLLVDRPGQPAQKIEPLSAEDVADRVILKTPSDPRAPRLPIPGPRKPRSNRDKNWQEFAGRMKAASVQSDIIAPRSTLHGFLFFDVNHHYDWLSDARLDVPDLAFMVNNEALFFFQVELAPAVR
jgi:hypothetical protein